MSQPKATYRVYCFDSVNRRLDANLIKAESDDQAVAAVQASDFGTMCEIWEGNRLVAQLQAERKQA